VAQEKYLPIQLPIAGPFSLLSRHATPQERLLGAKLAITYARSNPESSYPVKVGEETIEVSPFASKQEAQAYFFNA